MNLKNNKKSKTNSDYVQSLKKMMNGITTRNNLRTVEPLGVHLEDIVNVDSRGAWWLVGAAWKGSEPIAVPKTSSFQESQLLDLARQHKMNTDLRKSIFVILMSSEDYIDAHNRLLKLNVKDKQTRDIIRVIYHCVQSERIFNPYYAQVTELFCTSVSYRITVQYTLWDCFKEMEQFSKEEEMDLIKVNNLAKMTSYLINKEVIPLAVLRALNITSLRPFQNVFLTIVMQSVLQQFNIKIWQALEKMSDIDDFKSGIVMYLQQLSRKQDIKCSDEVKILKKLLLS
jgi:nucleolar MIF4G domain-containing protein 1